MKEADWLACEKVLTPLMNWLRRRGSNRQFYLAATGWVRQVEHALSGDPYRTLISLVEKFADGQATTTAISQACRKANDDLFERMRRLHNQGVRPAVVSKRLAADAAAVQASSPDGGWIAAINALKSADRVGKQADLAPRQMAILRDIFGNPFRPIVIDPRWLTSNVVDLARVIYDERAFERMPILGDALMDAGCDSEEIIAHCRGDGPHLRGCWVVDLLLRKE